MSDDDETISKAEHRKRLAAKQAKIDDLTTQLADAGKATADLQAQLKTLNPEKAERRIAKLMEQRDAALESLSNLETKHTTERAMLTAGITDVEDQELVTWRYSRLPEDKRPELGAWLGEGAKEDRHLAHLFKTADEGEPQKRGLPRSNNGTKQNTAPPNSSSMDAFLSKSGDYRKSPEGQAEFATILADLG